MNDHFLETVSVLTHAPSWQHGLDALPALRQWLIRGQPPKKKIGYVSNYRRTAKNGGLL